ncbi:MAG: hypothetical protein BWY22_02021 [Bacteroidetes bacterium ADurb.Bin217]|nr:MAG: hypothetical protein BWY22_02021 [Bacteroidetes bacterium ADurb.Bin217]
MIHNCRHIIFYILGICCLVSCIDSTCMQTRGKEQHITHNVDTFSTLNIYGMFDVCIIPDSINYIQIHGGSNQLQLCEFKENNSTISLYNYSQCGFFKQFKHVGVRIHCSHLDSIYIFSACRLRTDTISRNLFVSAQTEMIDASLELENNQTSIQTYYKAGGNIQINGSSKKCKIIANYTLSLNCDNFTAQYLSIQNNTNRTIIVNSDTLQASTSKSGKILYSGTPVIVSKKGLVFQQ